MYGQCGVGAYCLGGCDPRSSAQLDSCVPNPVCDATKFKLENIAPNTKYLGDYTKTNWVSSGQPVPQDGGEILTMPPDSVGSLLESTTYVWYGKITARIRTSCGKGVITAFILMSPVKDEIDVEWIGSHIGEVQSNYYYQGNLDYGKGEPFNTTDCHANVHEYTLDWTHDELNWYLDGELKRTVKRSDTYDSASKTYRYPQTPSRVMLSLWPGGAASNGKGTVDWAGGAIDWNDQTCMPSGYYYAVVESVDVECYDPPSDVKKEGSKAYVYTSTDGTERDIKMVDSVVVLGNLQGSGTNPGVAAADDAAQPSGSGVPESVPGLSGVGGHSAAENGSNINTGSDVQQGFSQGDSSEQGGSGTSAAATLVVPLMTGGLAASIAMAALLAL